jgi:hypothetical protein
MQKILFALVLAALTAGPVAASEKTDVIAVVRQFVDAFNKGDAKAALANCASMTSLLDDLPPHEWHGEGACARWFSDFEAFNKAHDITPGAVTLGKPRHIDITDQRAYLVIPTTYTFKMKGKPIKQSGSVITIALQKDASSWHMTGWAWADGTNAEVKADSAK